MDKVYPLQLHGDDIAKNVAKCDHDGFPDTCRRVLQEIQNGDIGQVTKHEVQWLLSKLGKL